MFNVKHTKAGACLTALSSFMPMIAFEQGAVATLEAGASTGKVMQGETLPSFPMLGGNIINVMRGSVYVF